MSLLRSVRTLSLVAALGCASAPTPAPEPATTEIAGTTAATIPNGRHPATNLLTGGQPTEADLASVAKAGYTTVISLRGPDEPVGFDEAAVVRDLGMTFVSIPVAGADGLTRENATALGEALDAAGEGPVVLHCGSGNRAGALLALKAFHVDGASAEAAVELGAAAGLTALRTAVEQRMTTAEDTAD